MVCYSSAVVIGCLSIYRVVIFPFHTKCFILSHWIAIMLVIHHELPSNYVFHKTTKALCITCESLLFDTICPYVAVMPVWLNPIKEFYKEFILMFCNIIWFHWLGSNRSLDKQVNELLARLLHDTVECFCHRKTTTVSDKRCSRWPCTLSTRNRWSTGF